MIETIIKDEDQLKFLVDSYNRNMSPFIMLYEYNKEEGEIKLFVFLSPLTKIIINKKKIDKADFKKIKYLISKELKLDIGGRIKSKTFQTFNEMLNEFEKFKNILQTIEFSGFYDG